MGVMLFENPSNNLSPNETLSARGMMGDIGHTSIELDVLDKPYYNSDLDIEAHDEEDGIEAINKLPSRNISALGYKSLKKDGTRYRKASAAARSKSRRPTHLYCSWRNNPHQLNTQILERWRAEDEDLQEVDEEKKIARRIEELREMTINLTRKKWLRAELQKEILQNGPAGNHQIGCWKNFKYSFALKRERAKSSIAAGIRSMGLWEGHLKAFASHFGTDVTAYFLFLRWLFVANVLIGLIILVFLFLPQMLYKFLGKAVTGDVAYLEQQGSPGNQSYYEKLESGREFITGKGANSSGWFTGWMYYGDYTDSLIYTESIDGVNYYYNMKVAYLFSYTVYFLIFFLVIAFSVAKSYRTNFIESSDKFTFQYVLKVVDGWDYMIDSVKTAQSKKKNIYRDFREFCASKEQRAVQIPCSEGFVRFMFRACAIFMMLLLIGGCLVAVYFIKRDLSIENLWIRDLLLPTLITLINTFIPFIFSLMSGSLKFVNPKSAVYTTLIMTMLLYGATLGFYFISTMFPCQINNAIESNKVLDCTLEDCWETRLGEKAYSLLVIDFLIGILVTLISEVMYRVIAQFCCQKREEKKREEGKSILPQYDIARNTMALIYNQFLLWLGIYYCPLLTVVVVIKLWLTFYMKRVTVMNACIPTTKPWRAAKMHTIFLIFLFIGFIFCAVLFGLALVQVEPSANCGPFTNQTKVTDVITDTISDLSKESQIKLDKFIMNIIFSPGVVFGVIVILCVAVHYVRVASTGRKTLISLLKIQITLESKDKAYLRHMLERVQKHKSSRRTANACNCDDTCSCDDINGTLGGGDNSTTARTRDGLSTGVWTHKPIGLTVVQEDTELRNSERRLFAKQRRSTTALESFHENRIPSSHPSL